MNKSNIKPSYPSPDEQAADVWRRFCLLWGKGADVVLGRSNWSSNDINAWGEFGLVSIREMKKSFHSFKILNEKISDFTSASILSTGLVTDNNTNGGAGVWVIHFVVNNASKWVIWSPDNQPYTLSGISTNYLNITEVLPNQLFNGGDSAVFVSNTYAVSGNSYTFDQLTSLPILVEEDTYTSTAENQELNHFNIFIYPNPSNNYIVLRTNLILENAEISISNI